MEFRSPGEIGIPPSSSSGYLRGGSAFSKPTLSPSSSLISPRAAAAAAAGVRNGDIHERAQPPPPPPTALELVPAVVDRPSLSAGKSVDQSSISAASSPTAAAGVAASANSKAMTPPAAAAGADVSARYKECLRNHAAAMGGHVLDGCGEFMPGGDPDTPAALKCAACGCHRSFHRREPDGAGNSFYHSGVRLPLLLPPPPHPQHHHPHQKQPQFGGFSSSPSAAASGFVQFGGGGNNPSGSGGTTTESSSEERINTGTPTPTARPRKRFRTKFTPEQKERMTAFSERIGWRIQRQDDAMVDQFCADVGVRRQVLKVWMHNNKHTVTRSKQEQPQQQSPPPQPPPPPPPPSPPPQEQLG